MAGVKNSYKSLVIFASSLSKDEYCELKENPIVRKYVDGVIKEADRVPQQFEHDVDKQVSKKYDAFDVLAENFYNRAILSDSETKPLWSNKPDEEAMQYVIDLKDYYCMLYQRVKVYVKYAEAKRLVKEGNSIDSNNETVVSSNNEVTSMDEIVNKFINDAENADVLAGMYISVFGDKAKVAWNTYKPVLSYSPACVSHITHILNRI